MIKKNLIHVSKNLCSDGDVIDVLLKHKEFNREIHIWNNKFCNPTLIPYNPPYGMEKLPLLSILTKNTKIEIVFKDVSDLLVKQTL